MQCVWKPSMLPFSPIENRCTGFSNDPLASDTPQKPSAQFVSQTREAASRTALGHFTQGESNMHQIVVSVSCRLCPLFPEGDFAVFWYRKTPCFYGESYYFYRISCMNPLFSPSGNLGQKGDAKWWTSIRCMFDSL